MTEGYSDYPKNLIKKAENFLSEAEKGLERYLPSYSNIITNCQNAIELSAKAIIKIMNLNFPRDHQLLFERGKKEGGEVRKEVRKVVKELLQKEFPKDFYDKEKIPRLIFLTYFWSTFRTIAMYGIENLNVSPDKLFMKEDAKLAVEHAKYCVQIAKNLSIFKESEERK